MVCRKGRVIRPEQLDSAPPDAAAASLADLIRINEVLGGHRLLRRLLADEVRVGEAFSFLDVGAASGDMGAVVRQDYPQARVTSLDLHEFHLRRATPPRVVADAFRLPFAASSFDFVFCSLFLHHFTDEQVRTLLAGFYRVARRAILITDLERHPLAYYFIPATRWIFGWSPITLNDAPISVEAAFLPEELERLARAAGVTEPLVRRHRPAFRLSLVGRKTEAAAARA